MRPTELLRRFVLLAGMSALGLFDVMKAGAPFPARSREIILEGTVTSADSGKYLVREFIVPDEATRLDISYDYTRRGEGVTIDIGLFDPVRFRGWSGSNKSSFFLSREAASPSYRAGDLPPGTMESSSGNRVRSRGAQLPLYRENQGDDSTGRKSGREGPGLSRRSEEGTEVVSR